MTSIYNFLSEIYIGLATENKITDNNLLKFNYILFQETINGKVDKIIESYCIIILSLINDKTKILTNYEVNRTSEKIEKKKKENFKHSKDYKVFDCILEFSQKEDETKKIMKTLVSDYCKNKNEKI